MSRSPSPVAFRRMQAGFVPASQRERCATCGHLVVHKPTSGPVDFTELSCPKVGFVTAWSVCKHWSKGD